MHTCTVDLHTHGLQDGCAACAAHAANPIRDLDDVMLRNLTYLAYRHDRLTMARSDAEAVASAKVLTVLEQAGHLAETAPETVAQYLRERWRLKVEIENPQAEAIKAMRSRMEPS
jgi:hypothetical protein